MFFVFGSVLYACYVHGPKDEAGTGCERMQWTIREQHNIREEGTKKVKPQGDRKNGKPRRAHHSTQEETTIFKS